MRVALLVLAAAGCPPLGDDDDVREAEARAEAEAGAPPQPQAFWEIVAT